MKKKRGRPRKNPQHKREERLDLRLTAAEKLAFKLAADGANQDLSVWIRIQLHRAAGGESTEAAQSETDFDGVNHYGQQHSKANADRASRL